MLAFPLSTLSYPSYVTNERFLVRLILAGPTANGGWCRQEREYVVWIKTECKVLLKGGYRKRKGEEEEGGLR